MAETIDKATLDLIRVKVSGPNFTEAEEYQIRLRKILYGAVAIEIPQPPTGSE